MEDQNNNKDEGNYEKICYICHRSESKAGPMISMPGGMCLCRDCMQKAFDSLSKSGMDFSKLPPMPYMNLNFSDMPVQPVEIPKKQKTKKCSGKQPALTMKDIPAPHQIKAKLDEYVIGQEKAKKAVCVAVYNHYKRAFLSGSKEDGKDEDVVIQKSNILMVGPTGSGKTYLVKTLAKLLDVPLAIADATSLTEAGYIGDDIESVVSKLLAAADNDVEKAEQGIIFIDEIDKIAETNVNGGGAGVSREGVQRDILPIVEGSVVKTKYGPIKTDHILFIAAGAFHVSKPEDLIPELQGRFPYKVKLHSLDKQDFVRILTETEHSLPEKYEALLAVDDTALTFTEDGLEAIAEYAYELNENEEDLGARRLVSVMEKALLDTLYEAGGSHQEIVVDEAFVKNVCKLNIIENQLDKYIL